MKIRQSTNYQLPITNYHDASGTISTLVERTLQIHLFMQNKPNFQKSQINVTDLITREYGKMDTWSSGKNKPNSNPKQTQFKPNTNPIQSQFKPKQTHPVVSLSNLFPPEPCRFGRAVVNLRIRFGEYYAKTNFIPLCRIAPNQCWHLQPLKDL